MAEPRCEHCGANRSNLHVFEEKSIGHRFDVARCLLCGWQISQHVPFVGREVGPWEKFPEYLEEEDSWEFVQLEDFGSEGF